VKGLKGIFGARWRLTDERNEWGREILEVRLDGRPADQTLKFEVEPTGLAIAKGIREIAGSVRTSRGKRHRAVLRCPFGSSDSEENIGEIYID
jgi:hypothetical protein